MPRKDDLPERMIPDREVLSTPGSVFVTQRRGYQPELVWYGGIVEDKAVLANLTASRPFLGSINRLKAGRIGHGRITDIIRHVERPQVDEGSRQAENPLRELGTNLVVVTPKVEPVERVLTVVAGVEDGEMAVLGLPETPDKQFLKVEKEALLAGGDDNFKYEPVPEKFSAIAAPLERTVGEEVSSGGDFPKGSIPDIKGRPVKPSQTVWIVAKDPVHGELRARKAFYMGMEGDGLAKFIVVRDEVPVDEKGERDDTKDMIETGVIPQEVINHKVGDVAVGIIPFPRGASLSA